MQKIFSWWEVNGEPSRLWLDSLEILTPPQVKAAEKIFLNMIPGRQDHHNLESFLGVGDVRSALLQWLRQMYCEGGTDHGAEELAEVPMEEGAGSSSRFRLSQGPSYGIPREPCSSGLWSLNDTFDLDCEYRNPDDL